MDSGVILFVDNDEKARIHYYDLLTDLGYTVHLADGAPKARELAKQHNFDLAIVDLRLVNDYEPLDNTGLALAVELSKIMPVIMNTVSDKIADVRAFFTSSVNPVDFIVKPTSQSLQRNTYNDLIEAVKKSLEQRQESSGEEIIVSTVEPLTSVSSGKEQTSIESGVGPFQFAFGITLGAVGILMILVIPQIIDWSAFLNHENRISLTLSSILMVVGITWMICDKAHRQFAFGTIIMGAVWTILKLLQR